MTNPTVLVCPECGIEMTNLDPYAHALTHWVEPLDPLRSSREARKRQAQCISGGIPKSEYEKTQKGG